MDEHPHEVFHGSRWPWPYECGTFPRQLGVVAMKTVLNGERPVLQLVHLSNGGWGAADGVGDPNAQGATSLAHMSHLVDADASLAEMANRMPPGTTADRYEVGGPWHLSDAE